jgi:hypothetical protein
LVLLIINIFLGEEKKVACRTLEWKKIWRRKRRKGANQIMRKKTKKKFCHKSFTYYNSLFPDLRFIYLTYKSIISKVKLISKPKSKLILL